jgi:hypothetical protein
MEKSEAREILGIENDEDADKAFRAQAKIHHPDVGGDKEKFELLRLAHETVRDNPRDTTAEDVFLQAFNSTLSKCRNPLTSDLIKRTIENLQQQRADLDKQITEIKFNMDLIKKITDKLTCNRENDIVQIMMFSRYVTYEHGLAETVNAIASIKEAIKIAREYTYYPDPSMSNLGG